MNSLISLFLTTLLLLPGPIFAQEPDALEITQTHTIGRGSATGFALNETETVAIVSTQVGLWRYDLEGGTSEKIIDGQTFLRDFHGDFLAVTVGTLGERTLVIYDVAANRELWRVEEDPDRAVFSPDGEKLLYENGRNILIADARTGEILGDFPGDDLSVWLLSWSPDGERIAAREGRPIFVRDAETGEVVTTFEGHGFSRVEDYAWSPDGTHIVSSVSRDALRVWDTATGAEIAAFEGHGDAEADGLAWSPDGFAVASFDRDGRLFVWEAESGNLIWDVVPQRTYPNGATSTATTLYGMAWSPDGSQIVASGNADALHVYDAATGDPQMQIDNVPGTRDMTWTASGIYTRGIHGTLTAHESDPQPFSEHLAEIHSLAWSPEGGTFASGDLATTVRLWDAESLASIADPMINPASPRQLAFSPDGTLLAVANYARDAGVYMWQVGNPTPLFRLADGMEGGLSVDWAPEGQRVLFNFNAGALIYDLEAQAYLSIPEAQGRMTTAVTHSPVDDLAASGDITGRVILWVPDANENLRDLTDLESTVAQLDFSPDGSQLYALGDDGTLIIWDVETGDVMAQVMAHDAGAESFSLSPDGTLLATVGRVSLGEDQLPWEPLDVTALRIWDTTTLDLLADLRVEGVYEQLRAVAWSPDGDRLLAGGSSGIIRVYAVARVSN